MAVPRKKTSAKKPANPPRKGLTDLSATPQGAKKVKGGRHRGGGENLTLNGTG